MSFVSTTTQPEALDIPLNQYTERLLSELVVRYSNPDLGFAVAEELAYQRRDDGLYVHSGVNVMQILTGYMPALTLPTYYNGHTHTLFVEVEYPEVGYMCAECLPFTQYNGYIEVDANIPDYGWAVSYTLPYTYEQGGLRVICTRGYWHEPTDLPYRYDTELGALVVSSGVCMPDGFAVAKPVLEVKVYDPSTDVLQVLGCKAPGDELMFGLELESSKYDCDLQPLAATQKGIWKQDYSCGVEFVTKPMSFPDMLEFARTAPVGTLNPDNDCGMHLHINRRALTQRQICMLALLISSEEYAEQIDQIAGRQSNDFCKKVKKSEEEVLNSDDRYEAVNLTNFSPSKYTVEIRIFAGTRYNHHLVERILWVYQLVMFVKSPFASADYGDFLKYQNNM